MNITATISGDCRYLSLSVSGAQGPATITIHNGVSHTVNMTLPIGNGVYNQVVYLNSTPLPNNGIFEIEGVDALQERAYAGAFGKCDLNCCIAKKVDKLLGCDCRCVKCNDALITSQRVHLLIVGIESDLTQIGGDPAANTGIFESVNNKYRKAQELCSDDCGCNC